MNLRFISTCIFVVLLMSFSASALSYTGAWYAYTNDSDRSGTGNAMTRTTSTINTTAFVVGNGSLQTDETNTYALKTSPANFPLGNVDWTFLGWFNLGKSAAGNQYFLSTFGSTSSDATTMAIAYWDSGGQKLQISGTGTSTTFAYTPPVNQWACIGVVYRASDKNVTFYVNGTKQGDAVIGWTPNLCSGTSDAGCGVQLSGRRWNPTGANGFPGVMNDVRLLNQTLTASTVSNYCNNMTGTLSLDIDPPPTPVITQINFTSDAPPEVTCTPGTACANTTDTTPSFQLTTDLAVKCRVSITNQSYAAMTTNCTPEASFDTDHSCTQSVAFEDGAKQSFFACQTSAGTNVSGSATLNVDTTAPVINLEFPVNLTSLAQYNNITYRWNITDQLVPVSCTLKVDGTTLTTNTSVQNKTSTAYNNAITSGAHNYSVNCTDNRGNERNQVAYFNVTRSASVAFSTGITNSTFRINFNTATYVFVKNATNVTTGITNVTSYNNSAVNQTCSRPLFNITTTNMFPTSAAVSINISGTSGGPGQIKCASTCNGSTTVLNATQQHLFNVTVNTTSGIWCYMDWILATSNFNFTNIIVRVE